jgi:hypothetical protein
MHCRRVRAECRGWDTDLPKSSIPANLMTEQQVLDALQKEVEFTSLTAVAKKYDLQASQLSDVLKRRANLSKRMVGLMGLVLVKFYEKVGR